MTIAFHLANALYLVSYAVRDILWLRLITGEPLDALLLVVRGTARVALADRAIEIADGTFIGELGFLTGKPPGADVEATSAIRLVRWPLAPLRSFLDDNPDLRATMQQVLGSDLATKLQR